MIPSLIAIMAASAAEAERGHEDAFRLAGATSPERAQPIASLGRARDDAFARLTARGVIQESAGDAWYLDEAAVIAHREAQRTSPRVLLVVAAMLAVTLVGLVIGMRRR